MSAKKPTEMELNAAAVKAMAANAPGRAKKILRDAISAFPKSPVLRINLAAAYQALSDLPAALLSVEEALKIEPFSFSALLFKATLLERQGRDNEAALAYGDALTQAPPEHQLDAATRQVLRRGWDVHQRYVAQLSAYVRRELGAPNSSSSADSRRLELFIDASVGKRKIFNQQPSHFRYPELPAIEFYEREEFPWLTDLESATADMRAELAQVLAEDRGLIPYVNYPDGAPLDQWAELNRSPRWSAFQFYHDGKRFDENCARCPRTMEAVSQIPQPQIEGQMPAVMFSVLKPRTRIPPHMGPANVRLVVHLPLVVPQGCGFRVGNQTREWREGQAWVFDGTIEHEAWNESDEVRVVFICDTWNPRLSTAERDLIATAMGAMHRFDDFSLKSEG